MLWFIVIAMVAAGNASPLNDAQLQDDGHHPPLRNELEIRGGGMAEARIQWQKKKLEKAGIWKNKTGLLSGCELSAGPIEDDNLLKWQVTMTVPEGSTIPEMAGKKTSFEMDFPTSYPFLPPKISNIIINEGSMVHPNINAAGDLDLNVFGILGEAWSPAIDISDVLLSFCSLLKVPN